MQAGHVVAAGVVLVAGRAALLGRAHAVLVGRKGGGVKHFSDWKAPTLYYERPGAGKVFLNLYFLKQGREVPMRHWARGEIAAARGSIRFLFF